MKTKAFENGTDVISINVFGHLVRTMGENVSKSLRFGIKTN